MRISDNPEQTIEQQEAHLALLAMRSTIPSFEVIEEALVRLMPGGAELTTAQAADLLASTPKPLFCSAENVDGVFEATCQTLSQVSEAARYVWSRNRAERERERHHLRDEVEKAHGSGDHLVVAFGREGSLTTRLSVVEQWALDYEIAALMTAIADCYAPLKEESSRSTEAQRRGAKGMIEFLSPSQNVGYAGYHPNFPPAATATSEERALIEQTLIENATEGLLEVDKTPRRSLPANVSEDIRREMALWEQWHREGIVFHRRRQAAQMRHFFLGRELPPAVAAFVEQFGRR